VENIKSPSSASVSGTSGTVQIAKYGYFHHLAFTLRDIENHFVSHFWIFLIGNFVERAMTGCMIHRRKSGRLWSLPWAYSHPWQRRIVSKPRGIHLFDENERAIALELDELLKTLQLELLDQSVWLLIEQLVKHHQPQQDIDWTNLHKAHSIHPYSHENFDVWSGECDRFCLLILL